jgi:hypothetical protein
MVQSYEMARLLYLRAGWMKNQASQRVKLHWRNGSQPMNHSMRHPSYQTMAPWLQ